MKFYEPKPGSPEAVNMSDDSSDDISTDDGGTPPPQLEGRYIYDDPNIYEDGGNGDIVLYLTPLSIATEDDEENEEEEAAEEEEDVAETTIPSQSTTSTSVIYYQDIGSDGNSAFMEERETTVTYNAETLYESSRRSLPVDHHRRRFFYNDPALSPINSEDDDEVGMDNMDNSSSSHWDEMD